MGTSEEEFQLADAKSVGGRGRDHGEGIISWTDKERGKEKDTYRDCGSTLKRGIRDSSRIFSLENRYEDKRFWMLRECFSARTHVLAVSLIAVKQGMISHEKIDRAFRIKRFCVWDFVFKENNVAYLPSIPDVSFQLWIFVPDVLNKLWVYLYEIRSVVHVKLDGN